MPPVTTPNQVGEFKYTKGSKKNTSERIIMIHTRSDFFSGRDWNLSPAPGTLKSHLGLCGGADYRWGPCSRVENDEGLEVSRHVDLRPRGHHAEASARADLNHAPWAKVRPNLQRQLTYLQGSLEIGNLRKFAWWAARRWQHLAMLRRFWW